jgi:hypothetical protein
MPNWIIGSSLVILQVAKRIAVVAMMILMGDKLTKDE